MIKITSAPHFFFLCGLHVNNIMTYKVCSKRIHFLGGKILRSLDSTKPDYYNMFITFKQIVIIPIFPTDTRGVSLDSTIS